MASREGILPQSRQEVKEKKAMMGTQHKERYPVKQTEEKTRYGRSLPAGQGLPEGGGNCCRVELETKGIDLAVIRKWGPRSLQAKESARGNSKGAPDADVLRRRGKKRKKKPARGCETEKGERRRQPGKLEASTNDDGYCLGDTRAEKPL